MAGQGYHCRRTLSARGLPKPLRFGRVHARFLKGRLFMQKSAQEGLGASARRCPFRGPSAKVIQLPDMKLSKNTMGIFPPSIIHPEKFASDQEIFEIFSRFILVSAFRCWTTWELFRLFTQQRTNFPRITTPSPKNFLKEKETGRWVKAYDEIFRI